MSDYALMRKNMIDCQLGPDGVLSSDILAAFAAVPREIFFPAALSGVSCLDEDVALGNGRFLLSPSVHARMLQAVAPRPSDVALDIGVGNGYTCAILSHLVSTVIAIESDGAALETASRLWAQLSVCNVFGLKGDPVQGAVAHKPYDLIVINGAVGEVPPRLTEQLAPGGRLVAIVRESPRTQGRAVLIFRETETLFSRQTLFDATVPYVAGFEPVPAFVF